MEVRNEILPFKTEILKQVIQYLVFPSYLFEIISFVEADNLRSCTGVCLKK